MKGVIISLYDYTGNMCKPYENNGWLCYKIDLQRGQNILNLNYKAIYNYYGDCAYGIFAAQPCDRYALSGNKYKRVKKQQFEYYQTLVAKTKEIIDFYKSKNLKFWCLENPATDIHTHNAWLGKPVQIIHPHEVAGYNSNPDEDAYKKQTWLFGEFNKIENLKSVPPSFDKMNLVGGKSLRTKNFRSATPIGLANAFYHYNH